MVEKEKVLYEGDWFECIGGEDADPRLVEVCRLLDKYLGELEVNAESHYETIYGMTPEENVIAIHPGEAYSIPSYTGKIKGKTLRIYTDPDKAPVITLDLESGTLVAEPLGTYEGGEHIYKIIDEVLKASNLPTTNFECKRIDNKYVCFGVEPKILKRVARAMTIFFTTYPDEMEIEDEYGSLKNLINHIKQWLKIRHEYEPPEI